MSEVGSTTEHRTLAAMRSRSVMPFLWVSLSWCGISLAVSSIFSSENVFAWVFALWCLCMADLFATAKAVVLTLRLVSVPEGFSGKPQLITQVVFWGLAKLGSLGILGGVLFSAGSSVPQAALVTGLGTMIVVPVVGGYWWSVNECGTPTCSKEVPHAS